jgi:hypothetical protein
VIKGTTGETPALVAGTVAGTVAGVVDIVFVLLYEYYNIV